MTRVFEGPVHADNILQAERLTDETLSLDPPGLLGADLLHADEVEQTGHVVRDDDDLERDARQLDKELHRVGDDVLIVALHDLLELGDTEQLQHLHNLGDLQELEQLRRGGQCWVECALLAVDLAFLNGAQIEVIYPGKDPSVWNTADEVDPEPDS